MKDEAPLILRQEELDAMYARWRQNWIEEWARSLTPPPDPKSCVIITGI